MYQQQEVFGSLLLCSAVAVSIINALSLCFCFTTSFSFHPLFQGVAVANGRVQVNKMYKMVLVFSILKLCFLFCFGFCSVDLLLIDNGTENSS